MNFAKIKNYHLKRLEEAIKNKEVDEQILPLLHEINALSDYVTSSSCAGRITLMKIPKSGKKNEAEFLFKSHEPVEPEEVWRALEESVKTVKESIWFKQEPFIVHVICKDLNAAKKLLDISHEAGLKHSGIISLGEKIVLEIQSTERIETIVAKEGRVLIDKEYLEILVQEANQKLMKTREKMSKLLTIIKTKLNPHIQKQ